MTLDVLKYGLYLKRVEINDRKSDCKYPFEKVWNPVKELQYKIFVFQKVHSVLNILKVSRVNCLT